MTPNATKTVATLLLLFTPATAFVVAPTPSRFSSSAIPTLETVLTARGDDGNDDKRTRPKNNPLANFLGPILLSSSLLLSTTAIPLPSFAQTSDASASIVSCLFSSCKLPLAKCIVNPKCLANVVCINTCTGKDDETGCQIKCGDIFENDVVGEFNKCALSEKSCVPKKMDDGSYPVPSPEKLVSKFDGSFFDGRLYITAGQNELFDIFPCQVHFFTNTGPGKFFGKLNWRVQEPDGEFFTRDALQRFVQDPKQPGHFINHDNEYLHYEDDWYVLDAEPEGNKLGLPGFALVYYRGNNDAWEGYGGAFVYTREAKLPASLLPRLRESVAKVGFDFDKDFTITDNSCSTLSPQEKLELREKFVGKAALATEGQLRLEATKARGAAANAVQARELYFEKELVVAEKAVVEIAKKTEEFEGIIVKDVVKVEKVIVNDVKKVEKEILQDVQKLEKGFEEEVGVLERALSGGDNGQRR